MTPLGIARFDRDGIPVLRLSGRLAFGPSTSALRQAVLDIAEQEACAHVLLDLNAVAFVDSSGLGALAAVHHALRLKGGEVGLFQVPAPIRDLLEMCRLTSVFRVFATEQEAVEGLQAAMRALEPRPEVTQGASQPPGPVS